MRTLHLNRVSDPIDAAMGHRFAGPSEEYRPQHVYSDLFSISATPLREPRSWSPGGGAARVEGSGFGSVSLDWRSLKPEPAPGPEWVPKHCCEKDPRRGKILESSESPGADLTFWHAWHEGKKFDCWREVTDTSGGWDEIQEKLWGKMSDCGLPDIRSDACINLHADKDIPSLGNYSHNDTGVSIHNGSFVHPCRHMGELLILALDFLSQNMDIVDWLTCTFDSRMKNCLQNYLTGAGTQELQIFIGDHYSDQAAATTLQIPFRLGPLWMLGFFDPMMLGSALFDCQSFWDAQEFCSDYMEPFRSAATCQEKQCVVADVAAMILHEATHCCAVQTGKADRGGPAVAIDAPGMCHGAYMIENAFKWAIGRRYPGIGNSEFCSYYNDPRLLFHDGLSALDDPPWPIL